MDHLKIIDTSNPPGFDLDNSIVLGLATARSR